jgi:hypothetical protein
MQGYPYGVELNNFGIMVLADVLKAVKLPGVCFGVVRMNNNGHKVFFKDVKVANIIQRIHDESIIESPVDIAKNYVQKA